MRRPDQPADFYTEAAKTNYIGLVPGTVGLYQINFRVPGFFLSGDAAIYVRKNVDCGFFFLQGCGRGLVFTLSVGAKLPIGF